MSSRRREGLLSRASHRTFHQQRSQHIGRCHAIPTSSVHHPRLLLLPSNPLFKKERERCCHPRHPGAGSGSTCLFASAGTHLCKQPRVSVQLAECVLDRSLPCYMTWFIACWSLSSLLCVCSHSKHRLGSTSKQEVWFSGFFFVFCHSAHSSRYTPRLNRSRHWIGYSFLWFATSQAISLGIVPAMRFFQAIVAIAFLHLQVFVSATPITDFTAYDYGFDAVGSLRRQVPQRIVVSRLPSVNGTVPVRSEIRYMKRDARKWNLYLLALSMMQNTDQDQDLSWYRITGQSTRLRVSDCFLCADGGALGIHGVPFEQWGGVPPADGGQGGYCPHMTILFPTWHRPYIALYEVCSTPSGHVWGGSRPRSLTRYSKYSSTSCRESPRGTQIP